MKRIVLAAMVLLCGFAVSPASAQQTTGNISGRITDAQGSAVPGVTVTAKTPTTGFTRTEVSDGEGLYRLTGLPVGVYELTADLTGFAPFVRKDVVVNVASTTDLNIEMRVAGLTETLSVTAES